MPANQQWRDQIAQRLIEVATEARKRDAPGFAVYCQFRAEGLRPQALGALAEFIVSARAWPLQRRTMFVDWIECEALASPAVRELVPQPLRIGFVDPTLSEWSLTSPGDPRCWRWLPPPDGPRKALELDPSDQVARQRLAENEANWLDYVTHEFPQGYLGNSVAEDILEGKEAFAAAEGLK